MLNNQFYRGMLVEMEKIAESTTTANVKADQIQGSSQAPPMPNTSSPMLNPSKQDLTVLPPVSLGMMHTTPSGTQYRVGNGDNKVTPINQPSTNTFGLTMQNIGNDLKTTNEGIESGAGAGVGYTVEGIESLSLPGSEGLQSYIEKQIDRQVNNGMMRGGSGNGAQNPFVQSYLQNAPTSLGYLNDKSPLAQKSHGWKTYNPDTNQVENNTEHGVKQTGSEALDWFKNNWKTIIGGGGAFALLSQLIGNMNQGGQQGQGGGTTNNYYGGGQAQQPQHPTFL